MTDNNASNSVPRGEEEVDPPVRIGAESHLHTLSAYTSTAATTLPSHQRSPQEAALISLLAHCATNKITISPSITARSTLHAGLGVYVNLNKNPDPAPTSNDTKPLRIRKNERLIHVPTAALLTTQSIPESFLAKAIVRKKFTVHCALAAYLAFGGQEVEAKYGGWMATWPGWEEFLVGMPVFWCEDFRLGCMRSLELKEKEDEKVIWNRKGEVRAKKRRKTVDKDDLVAAKAGDGITLLKGEDATDVYSGVTPTEGSSSAINIKTTPCFSRGPGIDETTWLTLPSSQLSSASSISAQTSLSSTAQTHLSAQATKLRHCIQMIHEHLPHLEILSPSSHTSYLRFLHMWAIVNTRCFYYLRPGQSPPADSNEAMALCPFQDLFNHASPSISISKSKHWVTSNEDEQEAGCIGAFDKRGFYVTSDREYSHDGEELYLRYGRHSNDMLWMEYGFFLGGVTENGDDYVRLDAVIFRSEPTDGGLSQAQKRKLEKAGYLGEYTLRSDGVCYRTVIASYLGILDDDTWSRLVSGGFDPESNLKYASARLKAKRRIADWVLKLRREAEANLEVLLVDIGNDQEILIQAFVNGTIGDGNGDGIFMLTEEIRNTKGKILHIARSRRDMCVRRWKQVFDLCMIVVAGLEAECPGAFVIEGEKERRREDLNLTAEKFVEMLEK